MAKKHTGGSRDGVNGIIPQPLPKPSEAALIAQAAYAGPWKWVAPGIRAIDTKIDRFRAIGYEGTTKDGIQILRDCRIFPWRDKHAGWGPVGFVKGVIDVIEDMVADCIDDARAGLLLSIGHSLGGSLAIRTSAHFRALGTIVPYFAYEPAACGMWKLCRVLADVPGFISFDGSDPVVTIEPWPYRLPGFITKIGHPVSDPLDMLARIKQHKIANVVSDLKAAGL